MLVCKDAVFVWGPLQIAAQEDLKCALLESPALRPLNYESGAEVILSVNTSVIAIGFALVQCDRNNPRIRYYALSGSIVLNECKVRYS